MFCYCNTQTVNFVLAQKILKHQEKKKKNIKLLLKGQFWQENMTDI